MSGTDSLAVARIDGAVRSTVNDEVALEEPLEIRLGHPDLPDAQSVAITMRTPGDDIDLAIGFLYGEGIVSGLDEIYFADHCGGDPNIVRIDIAAGTKLDLERLSRHFYTTSSCGVCGKTSLEALSLIGASLAADTSRFDADMLRALPQSLREQQPVFSATGGIHAAALFDANGNVIAVAEDVGRHNALDKVIGKLYCDKRLPAAGHGVLVSGRASFELMQKALRAGIPLLAAVGAPSSLAVQVAEEFGMTLVGFLREKRFNIYAGGARIT